jgi:hypothetical protein
MTAPVLVTIASLAVASPFLVMSQAPARDPLPAAVARVGSLDELLPTSNAERSLATVLDAPGAPLRPGLNEAPREVIQRLVRPPGMPEPSPEEKLASSVCWPSTQLAFATLVERRVLVNKSRTELFTVYRMRILEWIKGNHEPEVLVGTFGGRVVVGDEEYVTPGARGPQGSLNVGTSYLVDLMQIRSGGYVFVSDPIAEASGHIPLAGGREPTADALARLRRIARECGQLSKQ